MSRGSTARHGAHDQEWLGARNYCIRQSSVRRIVRQIFFARKESEERAPSQRAMIADGPAQNRIAYFERVENGAHRDGTCHFQLHFALHVREVAKVNWQYHTDVHKSE